MRHSTLCPKGLRAVVLAIGASVASAGVIAAPTLTPPEPIQSAPAGDSEGFDLAPVQEPDLAEGGLDGIGEDTRSIDRLRDVALKASKRSSKTVRRRSAVASRTLGLIYLHGAGAPQDSAEAEQWFARSASLGDSRAAAGMAWCALEGCADQPKPAEAKPWIDRLSRVDSARARFLLWVMKDRLQPIEVATPGAPAPVTIHDQELLERSAKGGNLHAGIELGLALVAINQPEEALSWFEKFARRSEVAASNARQLSARLKRPVAAAAQVKPSSKTPKVAAEGSRAAELFEQAQRYHRGDGIPANYSEALRLYQQAEAQGSSQARKMLELIYARQLPTGMVDLAWMRQLAWAEVSGPTPVPGNASGVHQLKRERSPLVDMLPKFWREQLP
ncbi:tetratricopeptide repeat protein [Hydrogenophaga sp. 5NK40-0174]|uniref:tetratricopeptide repeat protein n=1 Tax=Hydrogenophaga sp. 5NK40-0174 TaxID=3127649 RepID=UPI00310521FC